MINTIKSSNTISDLFNTGERIKTAYITFIIGELQNSHKTSSQHSSHDGRVAFLAGKRSGNAVWRNSAKRRMRALCCDLGGPWTGRDVMFLAKANLMKQPYGKVLESCQKALSCLAPDSGGVENGEDI